VFAVEDGDAAEVLARRPVLVQVALREHGDPLRRRVQSLRGEPRVRGAIRRDVHRPVGLAEPEADPGTFVERAVDDDHLGDSGRDRHRRLLHARARGATAVADAREERQLADAQCSRDDDLGVGLHRERGEAVDVLGRQAGVVEGGQDRLARQLQLAAPGVLAEFGGADADDRRLVRKPCSGRRHRGAPRVSVTVPVT
jgi:hypothetical protein